MGAILFVAAALALWVAVSRWRRPRLSYPPGPKPLPLVGNTFDVPVVRPWETWTEWHKKYNSDLIFLDVPFQPTVIIGKVKTAEELFDKRSHLYSHRRRSILVEMMNWDINFALSPYGPDWRAHRRMLHPHVAQSTVERYKPLQLKHARAFMSWMLKSPEHTRKHIRHMVTSSLFAITYGKSIPSMDDEIVIAAERAMEGLSIITTPGAFWVEYFPFLRHIPSWVPGATASKLADEFKPYISTARNKPFGEVETAMQDGSAPPSLVRTLIEDIQSKHGGTEEEGVQINLAKNVAVSAYAAGADTTSVAMEFFLLAMALHPEKQRKAQAVVDDVVGPNRLPEFEDLKNMPYLRAVAMECLRWIPIGPFVIPHAVLEDDVYNGYHIPKGATVVANAWAFMHDPEDYPEPELFKPERFLKEDESLNPAVRDPSTITFGFGRRVCPGQYVATNSIAIFIASLLHSFDITPGVDASGKPVELTTEPIGNLVLMPREIPLGIKVRSETARRLINDEAAVELEGFPLPS
ncbi:hypothetical protein EUX98_g5640 [Antrodiella citrinella]|uniref:Cytochrome P450 n=1 Tax=Antrodiella citrinella TaxID=2447956 RepID=A0A4S4MQY1_9APHY|nr:hypothetical protein EUX98_g5640 [Antrodiella citrinella]